MAQRPQRPDPAPSGDPAPESSHTETEIKLRLEGPLEQQRLLACLGPEGTATHQFNLYFDGPAGEWSMRGLSVRLRREAGSCRLGLKTRGCAEGDFLRRGEWEFEVEDTLFDRLSEGGPFLRARLESFLDPLDDAPTLPAADLVPAGAIENLRRRAPLPGIEDIEIELDESLFPDGQRVWEVEMEVESSGASAAAIDALRECFVRARVPWRPSTTSKRQRLAEILRDGYGA